MKQSPNYTCGVVGCGSIGSVLAAGLDRMGCDVLVHDIDPEAVEAVPYPAVPLSDIALDCEVAFVAVPTPTTEFGGDFSAVDGVLSGFSPGQAQVVIRSTMPPGSTEYLADKHQLPLVYMPEFLRDRSDADDFFDVDRMVLSGPAEQRRAVREFLEHPGRRIGQVIETDYLTAELGKYAHNAFFATKVSFANQMRVIAEAGGADPETVMDIVTADSRNTDSHLDPMLGPYGGKCLPKDVAALRHYARNDQETPTPVIDGVVAMNEMARESYEYLDIEGVWPNVRVTGD